MRLTCIRGAQKPSSIVTAATGTGFNFTFALAEVSTTTDCVRLRWAMSIATGSSRSKMQENGEQKMNRCRFGCKRMAADGFEGFRYRSSLALSGSFKDSVRSSATQTAILWLRP